MVVVNMADYANLSLLVSGGPVQRKLEDAVVVPTESVPPDVVTMHSTVVLRDAASGERLVVSVVYPSEADLARGRVSVLEPLGAELFAASVGDRIGRLRIAEIVYQPEQSMRTNLVVRD
jgi:regulator of nucleoside diphosphate kinase